MTREERVSNSLTIINQMSLTNSVVKGIWNSFNRKALRIPSLVDSGFLDDLSKTRLLMMICEIARLYDYTAFARIDSDAEEMSQHYSLETRNLLSQLSDNYFSAIFRSTDTIEGIASHYLRSLKEPAKSLGLAVIGIFEHYKDISETPEKIYFISSSQEYMNAITLILFSTGLSKNPGETGSILANIASQHIKKPILVRKEAEKRAIEREKLHYDAILAIANAKNDDERARLQARFLQDSWIEFLKDLFTR